MQDMNSFKQVEEWVASNGIEKLRRGLDIGQFAGQNKTLFAAWLAEHDRIANAAEAEKQFQLRLREIEATEDAARSARAAARWAGIAIFVSIAALLVSAWPLLSR